MALLNKIKIKQQTKLQGLEYRHFTTLRLINLLIIGLLSAALMLFVFYFYQTFFITIDQIQTLGNFSLETAAESINFKKLEQVEEAWQKKQAAGTLEIYRDPFRRIVVEEPLPEVEPEAPTE